MACGAEYSFQVAILKQKRTADGAGTSIWDGHGAAWAASRLALTVLLAGGCGRYALSASTVDAGQPAGNFGFGGNLGSPSAGGRTGGATGLGSAAGSVASAGGRDGGNGASQAGDAGTAGNSGATGAQGTIAIFPVPGMTVPEMAFAYATPAGIVAGSDGNVWFTEAGLDDLGRMLPDGGISHFPAVPAGCAPKGIASGPGGTIWFASSKCRWLGYLLPGQGTVTTLADPTADSSDHFPGRIAPGSDGLIYLTEASGDAIHVVTTSGTGTRYPLPQSGSRADYIVPDAHGGAWFTETQGNRIGHITADGTISELTLPTAGSGPAGLAFASDGYLWFAELGANRIGSLDPALAFREYPLPPYSGPAQNSGTLGVAAAPDGGIWFTESFTRKIGLLAGMINEFPLSATTPAPGDITVGADGVVWFIAGQSIGRLIP